VTQNPRERWPEVVQLLTENTSWGIQRFSDPKYLLRRIEIEECIRKEFIAKGGKPKLSNPIYFFLGRHRRFEEHRQNKGYVIDLKNVATDSISFTYGDSMLAYDDDYRKQMGEKYQNTLCAKIYRIENLESLFSHPNFPKSDPLAVEAQLWEKPQPEIVSLLKIDG
jgi:hypothetical protein